MTKLRSLLAMVFAVAVLAASCGSSSTVSLEVDNKTTIEDTTTDDTTSDATATDGDDDAQVQDVAPDTSVAKLSAAPSAMRTEEVYRTEMFMEMTIVDGEAVTMGSATEPMMRGEVQGANSKVLMDLGVLLGPMMAEMSSAERAQMEQAFGGSEITMEMITSGDKVYLKSGFFAGLASQLTALDPAFEALADVGDGYGIIDAAAMGPGFDSGDVAGATGMAGSVDFEAFFELIEEAAEVTAVGEADVRGVATTHYIVSAVLGDLMEAQGMGEQDLGEQEAMLDLMVDFDVFVDADGLIRRFSFTFDEDDIAAATDDLPPGGSLEVTMTMDFFDFDSSDIAVGTPADSEIVGDITEAFVKLEELGG